jgi:hypothetical protein
MKFLLGFGFAASGIYLSGWIFDLTGSFLWLYGTYWFYWQAV